MLIIEKLPSVPLAKLELLFFKYKINFCSLERKIIVDLEKSSIPLLKMTFEDDPKFKHVLIHECTAQTIETKFSNFDKVNMFCKLTGCQFYENSHHYMCISRNSENKYLNIKFMPYV